MSLLILVGTSPLTHKHIQTPSLKPQRKMSSSSAPTSTPSTPATTTTTSINLSSQRANWIRFKLATSRAFRVSTFLVALIFLWSNRFLDFSHHHSHPSYLWMSTYAAIEFLACLCALSYLFMVRCSSSRVTYSPLRTSEYSFVASEHRNTPLPLYLQIMKHERKAEKLFFILYASVGFAGFFVAATSPVTYLDADLNVVAFVMSCVIMFNGFSRM
jgi:hypothetical protein